MKPPERGALLSISASAARTFFDQDTIKGLQIRTAGDVVGLKGTKTTSGTDVVAVEQRGRGGLSALVSVSGTNSPEFFRLLRRSGFRSSTPFFLLTELPRDWVGIKHWKKSNAPLNQPYIRVWMGESPTGRGRKAARPVARAVATPDEESIDWRQMRRILTQAKRTLARRGRGMELDREEAQRDLEQFDRLITAVFPERGNLESIQARLDRAIELRQVAEGQRDTANDERDAVMEELAALQKVLDRERRERRAEMRPETEEPSRRIGRRRRQFNVHIEPEDHVAGQPDEPTQEPEPDDLTEETGEPEMRSVTETERLANELEELEAGEPDETVVEGTATDDHADDEATTTNEPAAPDADQPPTGDIEFPTEEGEDDQHRE